MMTHSNTSQNQRTPMVISAGEPAGIGPDIVLQFACSEFSSAFNPWYVIGDPDLFRERATLLKLNIDIQTLSPDQATDHKISLSVANRQANKPTSKPSLTVYPVPLSSSCKAGVLNASNSRYVLKCLTIATELCRHQHCCALVTAPIHKGIINDAGIAFTGHTEFLAEQTKTKEVVMLLTTDSLRVALVTTHVPLRQVAEQITQEKLKTVISILHKELIAKFGLHSPIIRICGLNPHAGEQGHLGHEEIDIIDPIIQALNLEGLNLYGSYPADTLFTPKYLKSTDAFLAMYHDQGLPVLKHAGFGRAVNVTLGLPIIRTSVDHGTALDMAGTGKADPSSFIAAIKLADTMANAQRNGTSSLTKN